MRRVICLVLLLLCMSCARLTAAERRLFNAHCDMLNTMAVTGEASQAQLDSAALDAAKLRTSLEQDTYWNVFWTNFGDGFLP